MLVKLYTLPAAAPVLGRLSEHGVVCRRAESFERSAVTAFVSEHFPAWVDETLVAFAHVPIGVFIAIEGGRIVGFACIETARPNFFGPTGVDEGQRGRGIGKALLLMSLEAMRETGYAYAIIAGVGPASFYAHSVGATVIEGSEPGIYGGRIR
jgi:predicted N-acetyltransferase YhbS